MIKNYFLFFALASVCFLSCKKDTTDVDTFTGITYAPANVGHEVIYDVDSIIKSDFTGKTDTFHFQIKEVIESVFTDNQGRETQRIERYKRLTPADPWVIYRVWSANLITSSGNWHYEKKEDNITFVKLSFPPAVGNTWNGNSLNSLGPLDYEYTALNEAAVMNGVSLDSSLTVSQYFYDDGVLDSIAYEERYAAGVGLYYKIQDSIHYDYLVDTVEFRRLYREKIVSFSN